MKRILLTTTSLVLAAGVAKLTLHGLAQQLPVSHVTGKVDSVLYAAYSFTDR